MTLVILQPCGNKDAIEHYQDTIKNSVHLDSIQQFLTQQQYSDLSGIYPDKQTKIWGVTPGKGTSANAKRWERISPGDVTLLAAKGVVFATAITTYKLHNAKLASHLWDYDNKGQTWEYIYFVSEVTKQNMPYAELNAAIPYANNYVIQGFTVLDEEKSQNVLGTFDLFSDTYFPEVSQETKNSFLKDLESLDSVAKTQGRREQSILRRIMFGNKPISSCCICGHEMPTGFLVAAHIKKRSCCTLDEKKDLDHVAAPMCKFGCDELYEKGYLGVNEGVVITHTKEPSTPYLQSRLAEVIGKNCAKWNENTREYFLWHVDRHWK